MVNYCVCAGCTNSNLSGHRVHGFPNRNKNKAVFRAWVRFVQMKRVDFNASSVTQNTVVCGAHFREEDYMPGDVLECRMGFRKYSTVRLKADVVPSRHAAAASSAQPATTAASGPAAGGSDVQATIRDSASRKRELCTLLTNTVPVVKLEDCKDMIERRPVTPEPAVKTPKKLQTLGHRHAAASSAQPATTAASGPEAGEGNSQESIRDSAPRRHEVCTPLTNTVPVVKLEDCEHMVGRHPVTPEPAVKTPEKLQILGHSESVNQEYRFMSSPHEVKQETSPVQLPENGKESGVEDAACHKTKSEDEGTATNQSANKENRGDKNEEFSTSLSVGDGHYLVDLGSPPEFIVDEECILQLFRSCRECNRQCTVRKCVKGLKLVVNQACCYCESRFKWTNLPDDDDGDFQTNGKDTQHMDRPTQPRSDPS